MRYLITYWDGNGYAIEIYESQAEAHETYTRYKASWDVVILSQIQHYYQMG